MMIPVSAFAGAAHSKATNTPASHIRRFMVRHSSFCPAFPKLTHAHGLPLSLHSDTRKHCSRKGGCWIVASAESRLAGVPASGLANTPRLPPDAILIEADVTRAAPA